MIRKLLLPILMIVFLTICNAQNFVYSTVGSPELRYTIISQGEKTCAVSSLQNKCKGTLIIPGYVTYNDNLYHVIEIEDRAFYGMGEIKSLIMPHDLEKIGKSAFEGCTGLSMVNLTTTPSFNLKTIDSRAFYGCSKIPILEVPDKVEKIGDDAFGGINKVQYRGVNIIQGCPWGSMEFEYNGGGCNNYKEAVKKSVKARKNSEITISRLFEESQALSDSQTETPHVGNQNNNAKITRIELTDQYLIVYLSVPSSTNKRATYRVSSGTIIVPDLLEYNDIVNKFTRKTKVNLIIDQGDLLELQAGLIQNSNNPYFTADLVRAAKETIKYGSDMREAFENAGLLIVGAGREKLDTEYKLYSKNSTNYGFTMYFNRKAIPVGCSRFSIKEVRVSNKNPKYWNDIYFELPCPYHTKEYTNTTENSIEASIDKDNDGIVGVYESVNDGYKVGVVKYGSYQYRILYISGNSNKCWETGHVKAELRSSATEGVYKGKWYMTDFSENNNCLVTFDGIKMDVVIDDTRMMFLKMYPRQGSPTSPNNDSEKWSGTGWALGSGYIVTNYHVIEDARTITIKGVRGDHTKGCSATVVATDKTSDLAVLKIYDPSFTGYGTIPYGISTRMADKGESIFVMGYPYTQILGDEVKYTTGEINSRTGYQGEATTYQISAQVDHGSSGGPMFDSKGNVIGIIVGGTRITENANYAIKTSYLKNLVESACINVPFKTNNTISTLSIPEKIKRIENFVFYIECSK